LSKLLREAAREPVQVEVSAVRVLFELLGFFLEQLSDINSRFSVDQRRAVAALTSQRISCALTGLRSSVYNVGRAVQGNYNEEKTMQRKASAVWKGGLKDGKGSLSAPGGVLNNTQYSFSTRFENAPGTNPEELIAAAHAGCFSMALSAQLGEAKLTPTSISTTVTLSLDKLDSGWTITSSHIDVVGKVPGADAATFQKYAEAAEKGCPVSKVLNAKITMNAKLE
jgi:lipoyl-dependent peroxiredoxin